jgi:cation transport protein ChaC
MSLTRADLESGLLQQIVSQAGLSIQVLSEDELQASLHQTLQQQDPNADVWVFAYGSLIWNPIFKFIDRRVGMIHGFHRRFCLWTALGRGTPDQPGLVLGLDRGGSCRGIAYRIAAADVPTELLLVWRREMVIGSYVPRWVQVFDGTEKLRAIAFTVNLHHSCYTGDISLEAIVDSIATAQGRLGSCADYLLQTVDGLKTAGIQDKGLLLLRDRVIEKQRSLT